MLRFFLLVILWAVICGGTVVGYYAITLPPTDDITIAQRRPSVTLLAADGSPLATFGDLFGQPLRIRDMPRYLPEAVIATEDRRFYSHFGVDPVGLLRAAIADIGAGHVVQGGSTITQQLARNLFLSNQRTFSRKIQEVLLAFWLEHKFTKNQILEIYLNRVYFGSGAYGVDAAARRYFGKSARQLSLYESAIIAGLLKAPAHYDPLHDPQAAAARADQVLENMVDAGYITPTQLRTAELGRTYLAQTIKSPPGSRYFADWVAHELSGIPAAQGRDIVVTTTLEPRFQAEAERSVVATLNRDGARSRVGQGALVAMSTDGAIDAMVGGRSYVDSQFNRATQALRQPGSSFKPFVYATALAQGMRPDDHFIDRPVRIGNWQPHNFEGKYRGDVTAAEALADSLNSVAAQVMERAGIGNVIATARRLGITTPLAHDESLALGTSGVSLLELTSAYSAFASGGYATWAYGIVQIRDTSGRVIYRHAGRAANRVLAPEIAGEMNEMLMGVMAYGTGRAARLDRPAAGKTGTTQDYRDALFVGYTADLVCGVWFGNDDDAPMRRVTGGTLPARTWHNFMAAATRGMPVRPLPLTQPEPQVAMAAPSPRYGEAPSGPISALQNLLHSIFGAAPAAYAPPPPPPYGSGYGTYSGPGYPR